MEQNLYLEKRLCFKAEYITFLHILWTLIADVIDWPSVLKILLVCSLGFIR